MELAFGLRSLPSGSCWYDASIHLMRLHVAACVDFRSVGVWDAFLQLFWLQFGASGQIGIPVCYRCFHNIGRNSEEHICTILSKRLMIYLYNAIQQVWEPLPSVWPVTLLNCREYSLLLKAPFQTHTNCSPLEASPRQAGAIQ